MDIRLLDENTYALYDGDTQIKQAPITQEMKDDAKRKKWSVRRLIADIEKVRVEVPVVTPVEGESVIVVPPHDHEYDERYAAFDHEHPSEPHEHPHTHDEFTVLKAAITEESQLRYKADQEQEAKYKTHLHPDLAQAFHTHADIVELLNVLNNRVTSVAATIPTESLPHQHNDLHEAIAMLRSEIHGLRAEVNSLSNRLDNEDASLRSLLETRIAEVQPKGEYITRDDYNPLTNNKRAYRVKVKSQQNVDGATFMNLEEV